MKPTSPKDKNTRMHDTQSGRSRTDRDASMFERSQMSDLHSLHSVQVALKQLEFDRWLEAYGKTKRKDLTRKQELELKECFKLIDSGASDTHFPFTGCCSLSSALGAMNWVLYLFTWISSTHVT
jgi:hypothetical protein